MLKNKKTLLIIGAIVLVVAVAAVLAVVLLKNDDEKIDGGNNETPKNEVVTPPAPAENTESLIEEAEKIETASLTNDVIEFKENVNVKEGDKVAVWVYSTPKFLGYFEVVLENGTKKIKGLEAAMKKLDMEAGEHNIAIVSEEGESIGYIDVYVEENKLFEDEEAAIVSKYTTKEVKEEKEIKFKTETKKDANKKSGSKEVVQKGSNGVTEVTYKITYDENGKEISKEKVSEKVITKAVNEIVVVGTADYNTNTAKITGEFIGFACKEDQIIDYDGQKGCNDSLPLQNFKAIVINDSINYVISLDEVAITPVKITKDGSLYKGTYKGTTHYFDPRGGGGGEETPLTEELCNQYKLNCGEW